MNLKKSEDGRCDCELCKGNTKSQATVIIYDKSQALGNQGRRAHLTCLKQDQNNNLLKLLGDWEF